MKLLVLCVLLGVACAFEDEWQQWKLQYGKSYANEAEESVRKLVWKDNWEYVQQHTAEKHSYTIHTNHLADLTNEEYKKLYLSQINMMNENSGGEEYVFVNNAIEATVDWRDQGAVTGVKNQGQCGSCWSFSATGSLEGQHKLKTGTLVSLSEQNLMDCSTKEGDHGCQGGLMDNAFRYIKENGGVDTEQCYPYRAHNEFCEFKTSCVGAKLTGYVDVTHDSESALQNAVQNIGPISVAIDASHRSFQLYHNGIYNEPACSSSKLDHGVLAIGYGDEGGEYWLVKNSWGTVWGMEGYVMMSRNKDNQCGIASQASYPTGVSSS